MGIVEATRKTDKMQRVYYALLCGGSWPYLSPKLNTNITMTGIEKFAKNRNQSGRRPTCKSCWPLTCSCPSPLWLLCLLGLFIFAFWALNVLIITT